MQSVEFTAQKRDELRKAYDEAVLAGKVQFLFDGRTMLVSYTKYLLEFLDGVFPRSFATEVIADNSGKWCGNQLRFATKAEADAYVFDLSLRWTLVRDWRSVESPDPVNARWENGKAVHL